MTSTVVISSSLVRCVIVVPVVVLLMVMPFLSQRLPIPTLNPPQAILGQYDSQFQHERIEQRPAEYWQTAVDKVKSQQTNPFPSLKISVPATEEEKIHQFAVRVLGYSDVPDQCNGPVGVPQAKAHHEYDLTRYGPFSFLKTYRNPCWLEENKLHCMPYFYLAGFPKCGTTDMYRRLVMHPDVRNPRKEPHWITRRRLSGRPIEWYTSKYASYLLDKRDKNAIVGDGSASTFWDNHKWYMLPGNQNCSEPRVITADYIRHLNPGVKIVVMLRNPTSRLYSDYMYFGAYLKSPEDFHGQVNREIASFRACLTDKPLRNCAYNTSNHKLRLFVGLYSVFMEDWLLRFPRDQILPVHMESVFDDVPAVMRTVFRFLNLTEVGKATMESIAKLDKQNVGKRKSKAAPMLPKTRRLLDEFYRPYNERLSAILQDKKFLWKGL